MKRELLFLYLAIIFLVSAREESVEFSQPFIQVTADGNKLVNMELGVLNIGKEGNFKIAVSSQEDFIEIDEPELFLAEEGSGTLRLTLNPTGKKPGVYIGEILIFNDEEDFSVPVIMELQTLYPTFDISLENIVSPSEQDSLSVDIAVYKLKGNSPDVKISYFLARTNGEIIFQDEEDLKVDRQTNLKKTFPLSSFDEDYVFYATASDSRGVSVGTGAFLFSPLNLFYSPVEKDANFFYIIAAAIIIFLIAAFFVFTYFWTRRVKINAQSWRQKVAEAKKDNSNDGRKAIRKLAYQLSLLESARARGYIKENSYREAKIKINAEIGKLKKRL